MQVLILMGSDSDWEVMQKTVESLEVLGVSCEAHVSSAHRTPDRTVDLVRKAEAAGAKVIVCGAGMAAHLAGVVAASTTLPVIAVPLASGPLAGFDALLSSVQMPPGVPVATVAVGGAYNAGVLAAQILATSDEALAGRLADLKTRMREQVLAKDEALKRAR
ncbi:MAG: 5-(carboxyamino)imidazole ribonucleotide mutase [Deltaproteobacteria bacterium]|nr:MAG: 5-(carboxyamino)imidazole ribonucleotide mutase [Deltaproteobacteria bacterium]